MCSSNLAHQCWKDKGLVAYIYLLDSMDALSTFYTFRTDLRLPSKYVAYCSEFFIIYLFYFSESKSKGEFLVVIASLFFKEFIVCSVYHSLYLFIYLMIPNLFVARYSRVMSVRIITWCGFSSFPNWKRYSHFDHYFLKDATFC